MLQPTLLLGHVLIVSGDFTVTSIMTVVLCPATASALKGNTVLTELTLRGCHIDAKGLSHLAQALCVNTTLRVLNLSQNTVGSQGARHLGKLSGGVWGYGLTCNIRRCQYATSNREMSVVKNVNADLRWSNAPVLRYCGPLLLVSLITQFIHVWILILRNTCEVPLTHKSEPHPKMLKEPTVLWCPFTLGRML